MGSGTVTRVTAVPSPSRRTVLTGAIAAAVAAVAGCTSDTGPASGGRTLTVHPTPKPSKDAADVARVARAIADEERLLRYCTALGSRPGSARAVVHAMGSRQRAHVRALRAIVSGDRPETTTAAVRVPPDEKAAIRRLATLVRTAREHRLADCLMVSSGLLARVLASMSASHACSLAALEAAS